MARARSGASKDQAWTGCSLLSPPSTAQLKSSPSPRPQGPTQASRRTCYPIGIFPSHMEWGADNVRTRLVSALKAFVTHRDHQWSSRRLRGLLGRSTPPVSRHVVTPSPPAGDLERLCPGWVASATQRLPSVLESGHAVVRQLVPCLHHARADVNGPPEGRGQVGRQRVVVKNAGHRPQAVGL